MIVLDIFECDLDPSPVVCSQINAYPTFCCPGDDTCRAHIHNVQVGYADGTIEELAATVAAACDELKRAPLPACSVNETAATYA